MPYPAGPLDTPGGPYAPHLPPTRGERIADAMSGLAIRLDTLSDHMTCTDLSPDEAAELRRLVAETDALVVAMEARR